MGQAVKVSSQLIQKIRREKPAQWTCSSTLLVERANELPSSQFWSFGFTFTGTSNMPEIFTEFLCFSL